MFTLPRILILLSGFLLWACETKIESHTKPYIAKQQPVFYQDGKIQHIQSSNPVVHRLVLIGDAGKSNIEPGLSTLKAITTRLKKLKDTEEPIVFLGDNLYQKGFQSDNTQCENGSTESQRLDVQLDVARHSNNVAYFVPGNHDWDYHKDPDMKLMLKQKTYIELCGTNSYLLPSDNKGMKLVSIQEHLYYTMIFLDSHALMFATEEKQKQAYDLLEGSMKLADAQKPLILFAHHPIATHGPHGGCYQQDYFGHAIINFFRRNGISWGQDINAKEYAAYIEKIHSVIPDNRKVIFAAGHDHNLQILYGSQNVDYVLVSGSGSHTDPACHGSDTLFSQEALGYIELVFRQGGEITADVFTFEPANNRLSRAYSQRLF